MGAVMLHTDPIAPVLFWVTFIFFLGLLGRSIAQRLHQPGVLGELLMGVLLGNACYWLSIPQIMLLRDTATLFNTLPDLNVYSTEYTYVAYVLDAFSRYGVIFLLFMVGLESSISDIKETGSASFKVAFIGVCAPMILGYLATQWLIPHATFKTNLFVGATLAATSVGITARVLKEMNKMRTREAKTILGAAVIDDILGLLLLAIVSNIVMHGTLNSMMVAQLIIQTVLFFAAVFMIGPWLLKQGIRFFKFLEAWEAKWVTSFLFLMFWSWLATVVQLAAIIGAFVAGLVLHDGFFKESSPAIRIRDLIAPLESLFAPLFFMLIGIQVKLETFTHPHVLILSLILTLAAVVGKLVSGWGAPSKDDRLLIGIGMLPRGEVGLVFASIGRTLGVISDDLFSAIIIMVMLTTFIAPIGLAKRFGRVK
jgi:Kef-type K+ transport system membrane component KefB